MIIDVHGHVSAPTELWAYKAGLLSHRGAHGRGEVRVTDDEILVAMRLLFERLKIVVEPSGASALAAVLAGRIDVSGRSVGVTLTFTAASVALKLALGMSASLLLHNVPRWGAFFGGLLLVPYVVPEVVRALAWRMILDPLYGGLNYILVDVLGVMAKGHPWLSDPGTALSAVIVVNGPEWSCHTKPSFQGWSARSTVTTGAPPAPSGARSPRRRGAPRFGCAPRYERRRRPRDAAASRSRPIKPAVHFPSLGGRASWASRAGSVAAERSRSLARSRPRRKRTTRSTT